jgi:hypothetical protein
MTISASSKVLVGAIILAGCTNDDTIPGEEEDTPIPGSLFSTLQAKFAGQILAAEVELGAYQYGAQIPGSGINNQCTTISGDSADTDGDRIPLDARLALDCTKRLLAWSGSVTGTQSVSDSQPDAVAWAFDMSVALDTSVAGPFGGSAVNTTTGTLTAAQASAVGPYSLDAALAATTSITTALGRPYKVVEDVDLSMTYTPSFDWVPGVGPVVTGVLDVDGSWSVSVNAATAAATLSTPTALTFDPECRPTRVTGGVIEASFVYDGKTAVISVEWTGCDQSNVTYDHDVSAN